MLEESKMRQNEILFVEEADRGVGYQTIAAMQRLGIKCKVRGADALTRVQPLQVLTSEDDSVSAVRGVSAYLKAPLASLQNQASLSDAEVSLLRDDLQEIPSTAHAVIVLPYSAKAANVQRLFEAHDHTTVVVCPRVVGFRDEGFFADTVAALRSQSGAKWEAIKTRAPFAAITISDLCGFLVSVFWNKELYRKTLVCPSQVLSPRELLTQLESELEFRPRTDERLLAKVRGLFSAAPKSSGTATPSENEVLQTLPAAQRILDSLPTATTTLRSWAKKVSEHLERDPESDLHFPPARSL